MVMLEHVVAAREFPIGDHETEIRAGRIGVKTL